MIVHIIRNFFLLFDQKKGDLSTVRKILIVVISLLVILGFILYIKGNLNDTVTGLPDLLEGAS